SRRRVSPVLKIKHGDVPYVSTAQRGADRAGHPDLDINLDYTEIAASLLARALGFFHPAHAHFGGRLTEHAIAEGAVPPIAPVTAIGSAHGQGDLLFGGLRIGRGNRDQTDIISGRLF